MRTSREKFTSSAIGIAMTLGLLAGFLLSLLIVSPNAEFFRDNDQELQIDPPCDREICAENTSSDATFLFCVTGDRKYLTLPSSEWRETEVTPQK